MVPGITNPFIKNSHLFAEMITLAGPNFPAKSWLSPNFPWILHPSLSYSGPAPCTRPAPAEVSRSINGRRPSEHRIIAVCQCQSVPVCNRRQHQLQQLHQQQQPHIDNSALPAAAAAAAAGLLFYCRFCCTLKIIHKIIELLGMCECVRGRGTCARVRRFYWGAFRAPLISSDHQAKRDKRCSFAFHSRNSMEWTPAASVTHRRDVLPKIQFTFFKKSKFSSTILNTYYISNKICGLSSSINPYPFLTVPLSFQQKTPCVCFVSVICICIFTF